MTKLINYSLAGVAVAAAMVCLGGAPAHATEQELSTARAACSAVVGQVKAANAYAYWKMPEGYPEDRSADATNSFRQQHGWVVAGTEVYDWASNESFANSGRFVWGSKTVNFAPGNFCLSSGKTTGGRELILTFQKDGNLVLYSHTGTAQWASNTQGKGARLAFQGDRNIVVYDKNNKAIWASSWQWSTPRRGAKITQPGQRWWHGYAKAQQTPEWFHATRRATNKPQSTGVLTLRATDRTIEGIPETNWASPQYPHSATYGSFTVTNEAQGDGIRNHVNIVGTFDN